MFVYIKIMHKLSIFTNRRTAQILNAANILRCVPFLHVDVLFYAITCFDVDHIILVKPKILLDIAWPSTECFKQNTSAKLSNRTQKYRSFSVCSIYEFFKTTTKKDVKQKKEKHYYIFFNQYLMHCILEHIFKFHIFFCL